MIRSNLFSTLFYIKLIKSIGDRLRFPELAHENCGLPPIVPAKVDCYSLVTMLSGGNTSLRSGPPCQAIRVLQISDCLY